MSYLEDPDHEYAERPNKEQIKREREIIRNTIKQLMDLGKSQLEQIPMSDGLLREIKSAKNMQKTALKRQIKHLTNMLADEDLESVQKKISELLQPHQEDTAALHKLEGWRDRLLGNDKQVLGEIMNEHPALDMQHVRQLIRNAQKERQQDKPPKSARLLFQYLKKLISG